MLIKVLYTIALVFVTLQTAMAQEVPKAEVFGGYSWAGGNFHGWNASLTGNITKRFSIVADLSGHYGSESDGSVLIQQDAHSFLFGPRFSFRRKRFTPFVYALSGRRDFTKAQSSPVKNYLTLTQVSVRRSEAG